MDERIRIIIGKLELIFT